MYFLNNLQVQGKINIITIFVVLFLGILGVEIGDRLKNLDRMYQNTLTIENLSTTILGTSQQGLEVTSALRETILNPLDEKAKENFIKSVNDFELLISKLKKSQNISEGFKRLRIQSFYNNHRNILQSIINKLNNKEQLSITDNTNLKKEWRPLKKQLLIWKRSNLKKFKEYEMEFSKSVSNTLFFVISFIIISIVCVLCIIQKRLIGLDFTDDFGQMEKVINENTMKTQKLIEEDQRIIEAVKKAVESTKLAQMKQSLT